jgi:hypothetical protein
MMKLIANTNFHNRKLAECSKTRGAQMLLLGLKQQRRNQYLESGEDAGDSLTKENSNWLEKLSWY